MKRNTLLLVFVGLLFAAIGGYVGFKRHEPDPPISSAVKNLFGQSIKDANGVNQSLSQWKGKKLVINFWATWCAPCVEEMPELSALQTELAQKNVQILGMGIDSPSNIKEFATKYKISYPLYAAGLSGTDLTRQFGNTAGGLPFTVVIGADGQVKKTYLGRLKMAELRADLALQ